MNKDNNLSQKLLVVNIYQKISLIIGIGIIVISLGGAIYFSYLIYEFTDYRVIDKFQDSDPKFFKDSNDYRVDERKLVNSARSDVIFPDDGLFYKLKVYNLKDYTSKITYELEKFKGGEREESSESGYWILNPNTSESRTIDIFLKEEGSYDLKLNLLFYNYTNDIQGEKYAQFAPPKDKIEVLSHANKLQSDANDLNFKGLIAASIIGGISVIALGFSVYFSKTQVNVMRDEIKILNDQNQKIKEQFESINRPWISLQLNNIDSDANCEFTIKNEGKLVAENMNISCKDRMNSKNVLDIVHHISYILPFQQSKFYFNIADLTLETNSTNELVGGHNIDAEITITYSFNRQDKKIVYEVISAYELETRYESIKLLEFN